MGSALITGATSGIGLEFAWELAAERNDLVLVARNLERLEEVAEEIRQVADVKVEVLQADLATEEGARTVAARVQQAHHPIGLLVNNAGFGLGQEFIGGDLGRELSALDAMVRAVLITSHAAANTMVARGYGAILERCLDCLAQLNGTAWRIKPGFELHRRARGQLGRDRRECDGALSRSGPHRVPRARQYRFGGLV